jgi:hypothetical protein
MLNVNALRRATLTGTVLQVAMVIAGHYVPFIALHVFMIGGMLISLLAGLFYARSARRYVGAAIGGAIAGGLCALLGIAVSVGLGDTLPVILAFGTVASGVTGLIGGVTGKLIFKSA